MRFVIAVVTVALGCRGHQDSPPVPTPPPAPVPSGPAVATDAASPPVVFHAGPVTIVSEHITSTALSWNAPELTPAELEDAADDIDALRARGRVIVTFPDPDTLLDRYDARTRRGHYRGHGLAGLDTGPIIAFTEDPDIERGEMPMGGHTRLRTGSLTGTISADEATWRAFTDAESADPLTMQLLIEVRSRSTVDGTSVVLARLEGVRVVRRGAREVYLEGVPILVRPVR